MKIEFTKAELALLRDLCSGEIEGRQEHGLDDLEDNVALETAYEKIAAVLDNR